MAPPTASLPGPTLPSSLCDLEEEEEEGLVGGEDSRPPKRSLPRTHPRSTFSLNRLTRPELLLRNSNSSGLIKKQDRQLAGYRRALAKKGEEPGLGICQWAAGQGFSCS